MFKAAVVVPTWQFFKDPFKLQPTYELHYATIIDSRFSDNEVKASVIDLRELRRDGCKYSIDNVCEYIPRQDIYFYWIMRSGNASEFKSVVEQLRKAYPESKHVAGGFHILGTQEESSKIFDSIVLGPGEESFVNATKDCMNKSLKEVYSSDWRSIDLNNYPFPRRHYIAEHGVVSTDLFEAYGSVKGTCCLFSRGCPFNCIYCYANVPNFRQGRSPEHIGAEIKYLKDEYNIKSINLRDELYLPLNKVRATKQLEEIKKHDIIWRGQGRIEADKDTLKLARDSGLVELSVGVESASQKVLDIIKKNEKIDDIKAFIANCKDVGIKVKTCFIFGLPGEPKNIVDITRSFIEEVEPDYANVSGLCPYPGSESYINAEKYGIESIDKNWGNYGHLMCRFSDDEHFGLPFKYAKNTEWGESFTRDEIVNNIRELQHFLKLHNKVW